MALITGKYAEWIDENGKMYGDKAIQLVGWAREGLTFGQIAHNMGINLDTLNTWRKKYPAINATLKNGREVADFVIENALYEKAKNGDVTAMIFWLKNRKPSKWRDKPAPDVSEEQYAKIKEILGGCKSGID